MKRRFVRVITLILSVIMALGVISGCGNKDSGDEIINDANTINVKIRKAGYGTDYIYELGEAFETAFADKGYKVNVLSPREDLVSTNVYREIYSNGGVDVYFASDCVAEKAVSGEFGQVFADITDTVFSKPAIKLDGTEEDKTVKEKLSAYGLENCIYDGKFYGIPLAESVGGLAVNTKVLKGYEPELELPRTTNEMFEIADVIMKDAESTDTYPFTFSLSGNNYMNSTLLTWMAQYAGIDEYNAFWSFQNSDGSDMGADCYKVYESDTIEKVLEVAYHFFDSEMEAYNSASQNFSAAQNQVMRGTAVFMSNGDWMFNEEFVKNEKYLNDVTFINAPVISALGVKLFGAETDYKFNDAKCDDVLSLIVKYAQAGNTVEQIKTLVDTELSIDVAVADVKTVCERAGYVKSDPGLGIAISEKSTKKEIAELFLRFCASQDGGKIFSEQSRSMSPYSKSVNANDKYAWTNSVYNILNNPYAKNIRSSATGYRLRMGVSSILPSLADPYSTSLQGKVTKYDPKTLKIVATDAVYAEIAKKTAEDIFNYAKKAVEEGTWKEIK